MSAYQYLEVIDLSATGAKLRGAIIPAVAKPALFRLDDLEVLCKVVWASDDMCGVRFDEPISPRLLAHLSNAGSTAQIGVLQPEERQAEEVLSDTPAQGAAA
jgi:hypothetical protein